MEQFFFLLKKNVFFFCLLEYMSSWIKVTVGVFVNSLDTFK